MSSRFFGVRKITGKVQRDPRKGIGKRNSEKGISKKGVPKKEPEKETAQWPGEEPLRRFARQEAGKAR